MNSSNRLLTLLKDYYFENKILPSYSQIAKLMGCRSKNAAFEQVRKFLRNGLLEKDKNGKLAPTSEFLGIPLFYSVKAGFTTSVEDAAADKITLDEYLIPHPSTTVMIEVSGDSMIEAGINEGDIVIVEKGRNWAIGDIVIAEVDGGYTLKFLDKKKGKFLLRAGNKKYPVIHPGEELKIFGVVTGVVRRIKKG